MTTQLDISDLRSRGGYTLIELLVVVAVIGVLASVALPQYWSYRESAADSAAISQLAQLKQFIEEYHSENLSYPNSVAELEALGFRASDGVTVTKFETDSSGVRVHIEHAGSRHYYDLHYPTDGGPEKREK